MFRAFIDNLRLAAGTFIAHPLRTALTLLGIIIGVATVMTMMALLEGLRLKVNKDLAARRERLPRRQVATGLPPGRRRSHQLEQDRRAARFMLDDKRAIASSARR